MGRVPKKKQRAKPSPPRAAAAETAPPSAEGKIRIQKVLAAEGVASRRAIEEMILEGRITVNGGRIERLPCFVDLAEDDVRVDGKPVRPRRRTRKIYFLLNKPRGVVCTQRDPEGRPRAVDLLPAMTERIYPVGRLDVSSTGLIILTNDGELTEHLTHPRYGVVKTYVVEVSGRIDADRVAAMRKGLYIDGRRMQGAGVKILRRSPQRSLLEISLREGRNREIRRMLARLGHNVRHLRRVAIGPVTDRGLKIGSFRLLRPAEVSRLMRTGRSAQT